MLKLVICGKKDMLLAEKLTDSNEGLMAPAPAAVSVGVCPIPV